MHVFKVVKRDDSGLTSVSQYHPHTFTEGQVTVSVDAPIFVFNSLSWAVAWAQFRPFSEVWKVEVDYAWNIDRIIHTMEPGLQDPDTVRAWWRGDIELKTMPVALGTRIAPAVKLLKPLGTAIVQNGQAEAGGP